MNGASANNDDGFEMSNLERVSRKHAPIGKEIFHGALPERDGH